MRWDPSPLRVRDREGDESGRAFDRGFDGRSKSQGDRTKVRSLGKRESGARIALGWDRGRRRRMRDPPARVCRLLCGCLEAETAP